MGGLTSPVRGTKCWKMETPAVAGASLRFTTVIDFNAVEVPVNHTAQFMNYIHTEQAYIDFCRFILTFYRLSRAIHTSKSQLGTITN